MARDLGHGSNSSKPGFRVRISTLFLVAAIVAVAVPVFSEWGAHDGGYRAVLAYGVFPISSAIAFASSAIYLFIRRSTQGWLELGLSSVLLFFVAIFFL